MIKVIKSDKKSDEFIAGNCVETAIAEMGDFHHIIDNLGDCVCKQSCDHEVYSVTFSASRWPSGATDVLLIINNLYKNYSIYSV